MSSICIKSCAYCELQGDESSNLKLCSRCKKVFYCSREHQMIHWKQHKKQCRKHTSQTNDNNDVTTGVANLMKNDESSVIVIEIQSGEGNGLKNKMIEHNFKNKSDAIPFIRNKFCKREPHKVKSPFSEFLGLKLDIFLDPRENSYNSAQGTCLGNMVNLNAAGVFLTINIETGLSPHINLGGTVFVKVEDSQHQQLTKETLFEILKTIYFAIENIYGQDEHDTTELYLQKLNNLKGKVNFIKKLPLKHASRIPEKSSTQTVVENSQTVVEIQSGTGNGLTNKMIEHNFKNKSDVLPFITNKFCKKEPHKVKSPFSEFLGLKLDIFVDPRENSYNSAQGTCFGNGLHLNAAGIFLTIDLKTGFSRNFDLGGTIFVKSQDSQQQLASINTLLRILKMISNAQSALYSEEYYMLHPDKVKEKLLLWKSEVDFIVHDIANCAGIRPDIANCAGNRHEKPPLNTSHSETKFNPTNCAADNPKNHQSLINVVEIQVNNIMILHEFQNVRESDAFIKRRFNKKDGYLLKAPFAELLGWPLEVYADPLSNTNLGELGIFGKMSANVNSLALDLTIDVYTGLSPHTGICGTVYLKTSNTCHKQISKFMLKAVLNTISDAKLELYHIPYYIENPDKFYEALQGRYLPTN